MGDDPSHRHLVDRWSRGQRSAAVRRHRLRAAGRGGRRRCAVGAAGRLADHPTGAPADARRHRRRAGDPGDGVGRHPRAQSRRRPRGRPHADGHSHTRDRRRPRPTGAPVGGDGAAAAAVDDGHSHDTTTDDATGDDDGRPQSTIRPQPRPTRRPTRRRRRPTWPRPWDPADGDRRLGRRRASRPSRKRGPSI